MTTILGSGPLAIALTKALLRLNPNERITLINTNRTGKMMTHNDVCAVARDITAQNNGGDIATRPQLIFDCTGVPCRDSRISDAAKVCDLERALRGSSARLVLARTHNVYNDMPGNILQNSNGELIQYVAIVKATNVIGPEIDTGIFGIDFLNNLYKHNRFWFSQKLDHPYSFTYIDDFAKALIRVGSATDTFGHIWHAPQTPAMSLDKWVHLFEVNTSRKARMIILPRKLSQFVNLFRSRISRLADLCEVQDRDQVYHSKYTDRFGNDVTYPSTIVKQIVQWFNKKKEII